MGANFVYGPTAEMRTKGTSGPTRQEKLNEEDRDVRPPVLFMITANEGDIKKNCPWTLSKPMPLILTVLLLMAEKAFFYSTRPTSRTRL